MAVFQVHKVVSALPDPLEPDAVYYVRTGAGFDVYVTDTTGLIAYAQNTEDGLTWSDYATRWDDAPTLNAAITGGTVYNYTLDGVTRYRFVPTAYDAAGDAFYATFDGTTLSGLIASRGLITHLPVTTAQLRAAGSSFAGGDESFAVTSGGVTYTFEDSDFNLNTSAVTDMSLLFRSTAFDGDIEYWNTSNVTAMLFMFYQATSFNQPLDNWDVSSVTSMDNMFRDATSFNQPLDNWDVSGVARMNSVFYGATNFNQPLDNWDVSSVTSMYGMFYQATSFNQPLDNWNVSGVTNMSAMFSSSGLSTENYSRTLIGWANRAYNGGANNGVQSNVPLGANLVQYNNTTYADAWPNQPGQQFTDAASARAYLVSTMGWTITDGGQV